MSLAQPHEGCPGGFYCRECGDMTCENCACYCDTCKCPCHGEEAVVHGD